MSGKGKVALVTGSTSGIGLAIAHRLAKQGVNVIITGFGDETLVNSIVSDIKQHDVRVHYVPADLSKLPDIESLWSEIIKVYPHGVDILVNNAGFLDNCPIELYPDVQWDLTVAVMLTAPFQLVKRSLPSMKKKGWGRIVNMSSIFGLVAGERMTSYTTVKHGLIGLTKGVALETAQHGITCNAICPGSVDTPMVQKNCEAISASTGMTVEEVREMFKQKAATNELIEADQVAELVEFLCFSNASSQMTGAAYSIDGGYTTQ